MCVSKCPDQPFKMYGDPVTTMCVSRCPPHLYGHPNSNLCVPALDCPANHYGDNSTNLCVSRCPAV